VGKDSFKGVGPVWRTAVADNASATSSGTAILVMSKKTIKNRIVIFFINKRNGDAGLIETFTKLMGLYGKNEETSKKMY
jgi:hypothetical protein